MAPTFLGIDVGGTAIKWAVVDERSRVLQSGSAPARAANGRDAVLAAILLVLQEALATYADSARIGLALPGRIDAERGTVVTVPNFAGRWRDYPIRQWLERQTDAPVVLMNDVNALTLAEFELGAGRNSSVLLCVAVGTGIGAGVAVNGSIHLGLGGAEGEIGHVTVDTAGPVCGCGSRGCLETFASAKAIARAYGAPSAEAVARHAERGDPAAKQVFAGAADSLATVLSAAVALLSPDRVVLGGGVAQSGEVLLGPVRQALRKGSPVLPIDEIEIRSAALGPIGGAIGAGLWAKAAHAGGVHTNGKAGRV